jgi:hypothetical protein
MPRTGIKVGNAATRIAYIVVSSFLRECIVFQSSWLSEDVPEWRWTLSFMNRQSCEVVDVGV